MPRQNSFNIMLVIHHIIYTLNATHLICKWMKTKSTGSSVFVQIINDICHNYVCSSLLMQTQKPSISIYVFECACYANLLQFIPCTCTFIRNKSVTKPSITAMLYFPWERHKGFFTCFQSATHAHSSILILSTLPYHSHLPILCFASLHLFSREYSFLTAPANWKILCFCIPAPIS